MKGQAKKTSLLASATGAALAVCTGLLLWGTPFGDSWTNASYDYLFWFGSHAVTNRVTLVLMDNSAYNSLGQTRAQPWDRALHAKLLNRLADDGCTLVAIDALFHDPHELEPDKDDALATAMRRQQHMVLMAELTRVTHPGVDAAQLILPADKFMAASGTNWGVAWLDPDLSDLVVRKQWPYPSPELYPGLPWKAAQLLGKHLPNTPRGRWLRYYGQSGPWARMSYQFALAQPTNYFRNQIVFVGNWPETTLPNSEQDKFSTPYTRWTREASGGVEILLTTFLNLLNDESLLRPAPWIESILITIAGALLGGGMCRLPFLKSLAAAAGIAMALSLAAVSLSYFTNYWLPWLIIVGAQVPCAVAWSWFANQRRERVAAPTSAPLPVTPGYVLMNPPFGEGSYGKVWLARNHDGEWRALKVVYLAKFDGDPDPYEREYNGIKKYQPVSGLHPSLLRVDFVSEKLPGYFYYVMELGDALADGWEKNPASYKPRDLVTARTDLPKRRLPVKECFRIGIALSEALDFMHRQGMTHRDIKPQNIIFLNRQPKLADLGLITGIRSGDEERTLVGTRGYMPPPPERPGTAAADIYALGMVLYVLSTGRSATLFPEVATTLVNTEDPPDFIPLNQVILKACQPVAANRYASAMEMRNALEQAQARIAD